ncbi:peptidoglycan-binding domain-containing protein [Catellatospora citrea]|uniref:peptidoglycan-binding domain-containing protein n=1 Tax=Catellatospora citrea TaxID=53366 RepID=UPI0033EA959C
MRRFIIAAVLSAAVATGVVAVESPAYAAEPKCDEKVYLETSYDELPAAVPSYNQTPNGAMCSLAPGDYNNAVAVLQTNLNECYQRMLAGTEYAFGWLSVDKEFGPLTKAALIQVQKYHEISADGGYGPQTRNAIDWWIGSRSSSPPYWGHCETLIRPYRFDT